MHNGTHIPSSNQDESQPPWLPQFVSHDEFSQCCGSLHLIVILFMVSSGHSMTIGSSILKMEHSILSSISKPCKDISFSLLCIIVDFSSNEPNYIHQSGLSTTDCSQHWMYKSLKLKLPVNGTLKLIFTLLTLSCLVWSRWRWRTGM
jgi:hypothetical protein